jgi:predicted dithiol-disulfide oxidoreductase (DUF899 family)
MPNVVTREEWDQARAKLLDEEKAHTRQGDALAQKRRELPWVRMDDYTLMSAEGPVAFADLFGERSQLIVYHFMYGPDWDKPCPSCSFWADHFDGTRGHLANRDVELAVISRAPIDMLNAWKPKAGWRFPWVSSFETTFNQDLGATSADGKEIPLFSVFAKNDDGVFLTYSAGARGLETLNSTYGILDTVPKGRDEAGLEWTMAWVRRLADDAG